MKITNNRVGVNSYKTAAQAALHTNASKTSSAGKSFDTLIIKSSAGTVSDEKFASGLSSGIASEIRKSTPQETLDDLRSQVASGTYSPALDDVARRILLG